MSIKNILEENRVKVAPDSHHHARSGWVQVDCPYCGKGSEKFHMGFNLESGYCNCWKCGYHPVIQTLHILTGLSYKECGKLIKGITPERVREKPPTGVLRLPEMLGPLLPAHKKYLKSRGFNPEQIQKLWRIQGLGIAPKLSWRIFIPILYEGKMVSWTTRALSDNIKKRYDTAYNEDSTIPPKKILYGLDYVRGTIIVVEGPLDVWKIGPGAAATLGTSYTMEQLNLITKFPTRVIWFDNEPEAQKVAKKLVNDLSPFPGTTYNIVSNEKDAADSSEKTISRIRRKFLL